MLDTPGNPVSDGDPKRAWEGISYVLEGDLAAFARLQINRVWYRVSDHLNWHITLHVSCHDGQWQDSNHYSEMGDSPASN